MEFDSHLTKYLNGEEFSNSLDVDFGGTIQFPKRRLDCLAHICKDKNVIHFGCADHPPLISKKLEKGRYLHEILTNCTKKVVGLDFNQQGIDIMRDRLNYDDVYCFDLFNPQIPDTLNNKKFDYIVMGEILEHVDDPVDFLKRMKDTFSSVCQSIIITVPNIACLDRYKSIKNNFENINSDHRYWFTPYTLAKVITRANMQTVLIEGTDARRSINSFGSFVAMIKRTYSINDCRTLVGIADL